MSEIVDLRTARKLAARREQQERAVQNRIAHGRGRTEQQLEKMCREKAEHAVDQHRFSPDSEA